MQRRCHSVDLRQQISVVEGVVLLRCVECGRCYVAYHLFESLPCHEVFACHDAVAQRDGFGEESAVHLYGEQTLRRRKLGVEQTHIHGTVLEVEVVAQHAVVEQHLHIVFLYVQTAVAVVSSGGDVVVCARLLFYEQAFVGGHQIDTPLYAEAFAYERRLEQCLLASSLCEEGIDGGIDVACLECCVVLEASGVELRAGGVFHGFVAEVGDHGAAYVVCRVVDDVVEGLSCEVTQECCLRVGARLHAVEGVEQGVMPEVFEA